MAEKFLTTYSFWNMFRNCRTRAWNRYGRHLVPIARKDKNLSFGAAIHSFLKLWHEDRNIDRVRVAIKTAFPEFLSDAEQKRHALLSRAIMEGYATKYAKEPFKVVALEKVFEGQIKNPTTGHRSGKVTIAGKVDGIVSQDGQYVLIEHKTTSTLNAAYIETLWFDFQVLLYSYYSEEALGYPISKVIYNIIVKTQIKQKQGESDLEFLTRLKQKYADPAMFHREELFLSKDTIRGMREELWCMVQSFLYARRMNYFYRNDSFCFHWYRPCEYLPLCKANESDIVLKNLYKIQPPHEELREEEEKENEPF